MSAADWADEVFDALYEGKHVLLSLPDPKARPIVVTVSRGTRATAEFTEEGIALVSDEAPQIVSVDEDGNKEVRQCAGSLPIGGGISSTCQLDSGHSGEHFFGD